MSHPHRSPPHGPVPLTLHRERPDALEAALRAVVRGEVRFDAGSRALYATTGSNYRLVPLGLVVPVDETDVERAMAVCRRFDVPVLSRGGGTSLAGQTTNTAVVLDFSKVMRRVVALDPDGRTASVEPGVVLDELRDAAERHGLTFAPDPSTHAYCTLGGMIGNNSCGVHSVMGGRTSDNVDALEILTYDGVRLRVGPASEEEIDRIVAEGGRKGQIYGALRELRDRYADEIRERFPAIKRRVSGYNLDELLPERGFHVARALVGSEGTCVTVLEATVRLVPSPRCRVLLVLGYPDVYQAADHVPRILEAHPIGLEGMDDRLVSDLRDAGLLAARRRGLPDGRGWLLAEFGAPTRGEAAAAAADLMEALARERPDPPSMRLVEDADEQHDLWVLRESGLGATAHVPGQPLTWEGWEDAAVAPERLGAYLRDFRALLDRHGYACDLYGHFGDGCVHTRIDFDLASEAGTRAYRRFVEEAADLVTRYGGSLSGEHGDGQARGELLPRMFGARLMDAFREFKRIWDPGGRMNPGKLVDADPVDAHLRLGPDYAPRPVETHFAFSSDGGDFNRAMLRCVGVGACRKTDAGTMCPSYMVTKEEMHSTRGRARLLFEMLKGDALDESWRNGSVKEALDLCLACKGCKGECPVQVDMATYKAEFLAHYYEGRLRPLYAFAFGLIFRWARLAAFAPRVANWFTQRRLPAAAAKRLLGIAPERRLPAFAPRPFTERMRPPRPAPGGRRVILWPDTFTNYFHPEIGESAVEVLEHCGFSVELPPPGLCCGRPLYDFGMLDTAKRQLRAIVDALRPAIRAGVHVVGLEPSCVSVFRDELVALLPEDRDARCLSEQTMLLGEFLVRHAPEVGWPVMEGRAVLHLHCHQKAVLDAESDATLLRRLGLDCRVLDAGCCGMAGSFGFEARHYDVSIACGERVLLPAVRSEDRRTWIVADGFSCREQIAQTVGRTAVHLAQVLSASLGRTVQAAETPMADARRGAPSSRPPDRRPPG